MGQVLFDMGYQSGEVVGNGNGGFIDVQGKEERKLLILNYGKHTCQSQLNNIR
jgi:hypothetical protein